MHLTGIQYIFRYHKYQKTSREPDSPCRTPTASHPASRAMSTTTLISEVISMVKLRPKPSLRHCRLRESIDAEALEHQQQQHGSSCELSDLERSQSTNTLKNTSGSELASKTFKLVNKRLEKLGLSPPNETASLPELPINTPMMLKKRPDGEKPKSIGNLEEESSTAGNGTLRKIKYLTTPSPNEKDSVSDASEKRDEERSEASTSASASNSTLTNVSISDSKHFNPH